MVNETYCKLTLLEECPAYKIIAVSLWSSETFLFLWNRSTATETQTATFWPCWLIECAWKAALMVENSTGAILLSSSCSSSQSRVVSDSVVLLLWLEGFCVEQRCLASDDLPSNQPHHLLSVALILPSRFGKRQSLAPGQTLPN